MLRSQILGLALCVVAGAAGHARAGTRMGATMTMTMTTTMPPASKGAALKMPRTFCPSTISAAPIAGERPVAPGEDQ
jgi:hypothetical protein